MSTYLFAKVNHAPDTGDLLGHSLPDDNRSKKSSLKQQQFEAVSLLYDRAIRESTVEVDKPTDISDLIGSTGMVKRIFPLPGRQKLGAETWIGLPKSCASAQVEGIKYDNESEMYHLLLSAKNKDGIERKVSICIVRNDSNEYQIQTERNFQTVEIRRYYEQAISEGIAVDSSLDISSLITCNGTTLKNFPLPNGQAMGASKSIGLPKCCAEVHLEKVTYDNRSGDYRLLLSARDRNELRREIIVFLVKDESDKYHIQTKQDLQVLKLRKLYEQAERDRVVQIQESLDLSELVGATDKLLTIFPLPKGQRIGAQMGVGLPQHCIQFQLKALSYQEKSGVFTMALHARDNLGMEREMVLHIIKDDSDRYQIQTRQDFQIAALSKLYIQVKKEAEVELNELLDISTLIGSVGSANVNFPLPGERKLGDQVAIGLPEPCCDAKLKGIKYEGKSGNYHLLLSGKDNKNAWHEAEIYLVKDEAGQYQIQTEHKLQLANLRELYIRLRKESDVEIKESLDISTLISVNGKMKRTFPLPEAQKLGTYKGIGFPESCSEARLERAKYEESSERCHIALSARNRGGARQEVEIYFVKNDSGDYQVLTKSEFQIAELEALYSRACEEGVIQMREALDISTLFSSDGSVLTNFPLPDGEHVAERRGVSLPKPCGEVKLMKIEYEAETERYALLLSAKDRKGIIRQGTEFFLVKNELNKYQIQTQKELQIEELRAYYERAEREGGIEVKEQLVISSLISRDGQIQMIFPLPEGQRLRVAQSIGLPSPNSDAKLESIKYEDESGLYKLILSVKDRKEMRRKVSVYIIKNSSGDYQIQSEQGFQILELRALYEQAEREESIDIGLPLDVSHLIGGNGHAQINFPLPDGQKVGVQKATGLSNDLLGVYLTDITSFGNSYFHLMLEGHKSRALVSQTTIIVSPDGITTRKSPSSSTEIFKGYCLDRYVDHLLAEADIEAVSNPKFYGSSLIGEAFVPNFLSGTTAIHAKWGERGNDVFDYIRKYARLREVCSGVESVLHIVASDIHLADLRDVTTEFTRLRHGTFAESVVSLLDWVQSIEYSQTAARRELALISAMAEMGNDDWLRKRNYSTKVEKGRSEILSSYSTEHTVRIRELLSRDGGASVVEVLERHLEIHSQYWEKGYHITLAGCCSYLVDQALGKVQVSPQREGKIQDLVYQLYPALRSYPEAWRMLLYEGVADSEMSVADAQGSPPCLTAFNLEQELVKLGVVKIKDEMVPTNDLKIKTPEVRKQLWEVLEECGGDIALALRTVFRGQISDRDRRVFHLESLRVLSSLFFDVRVAQRLPEVLNELKMRTDRETLLLSALAQLAPSTKLNYLFRGQTYAVSVRELLLEFE